MKRLTTRNYNYELFENAVIGLDTQNSEELIMPKSLLDMVNKLQELENKIENGTLIELPCKVGDKCYPLLYHSKITEETVSRITITKRNIIIGYYEHNEDNGYKPLRTRTLGEDVWLKKEDIPQEYKGVK